MSATWTIKYLTIGREFWFQCDEEIFERVFDRRMCKCRIAIRTPQNPTSHSGTPAGPCNLTVNQTRSHTAKAPRSYDFSDGEPDAIRSLHWLHGVIRRSNLTTRPRIWPSPLSNGISTLQFEISD